MKKLLFVLSAISALLLVTSFASAADKQVKPEGAAKVEASKDCPKDCDCPACKKAEAGLEGKVKSKPCSKNCDCPACKGKKKTGDCKKKYKDCKKMKKEAASQ